MAVAEQEPPTTGGLSLHGKKLTRVTLADSLQTQLQQQVLSGRLEAGQPLPSEREISEAFGVGRTTVREALQGLVASGFVERQNSNLIVKDPMLLAPDKLDYAALAARLSIREVFETRKLIEVETARLAAEYRTEEGIEKLRGIVDAMGAADEEAYHGLDIAFHVAVARMGNNQVLAQVYESSQHLFFKLPAFWRVFGQRPDEQPRKRVGGGPRAHRVIFEAIERGDSAAAVAAVVDLLDRVQHGLIDRVATSSGRAAGDGAAPATGHQAEGELSGA